MYHLFNKIRLSPIGGIAQPSLIFFSLYIVCLFVLISAPFVWETVACWPHVSLKKYYIFAYVQIKIMALFKVILKDMQFSRVWITQWRMRRKEKKTAVRKENLKRGSQNKTSQSIFIMVQFFCVCMIGIMVVYLNHSFSVRIHLDSKTFPPQSWIPSAWVKNKYRLFKI